MGKASQKSGKKKGGGTPPQGQDSDKKKGRPVLMKALNKKARKGTLQAKVNSAHKGSKLNKWKVEDMEGAISHYQGEMKKPDHCRTSLSDIAQIWSVPYSTLWYRVKGIIKGIGHQSGGKNRSRLLPEVAEKELSERLSKFPESCNGEGGGEQ